MKSLETVGLFGLYLFSYTAVLGIAGANIGLLLMLIAMLPQLPDVWQVYRSSRVVRLILLGLFYVVASGMIAGFRLPETWDHQWDQVVHWGDLGLVLLVAWWLKGEPKRLYISFALFALGALTRVFLFFPWEDFSSVIGGDYRPWGFGLWHISFSSYLVVVLLGLALFSRRLLASISHRWGRFLAIAGLILVSVISIEVIMVGKARGTWLAALLVVPVVLVFYCLTLWRSSAGFSVHRAAGFAGIGLVLASIVVFSQLDGVANRLAQERETYRALLEEEVANVPTSSIGIRIHLWHHGIDKWLERPLFGWGTGSEKYLMEQKWMSGVFGQSHYIPPHFHNIYLEILVRFGLVGFFILASIVWFVYREVWKRYREGRIPADWFYFLVGTLLFSMIWSCFDIRIVKWDYRDFVLLFFAAAMVMTRPFADPAFYARLRFEAGQERLVSRS